MVYFKLHHTNINQLLIIFWCPELTIFPCNKYLDLITSMVSPLLTANLIYLLNSFGNLTPFTAFPSTKSNISSIVNYFNLS